MPRAVKTLPMSNVQHLRDISHAENRNPVAAFDAEVIDSVRVNRSAAERRVATLLGRRTVKKQWQAAWLVRAIQCIDLTTLSGDDTPGRVRRLVLVVAWAMVAYFFARPHL